MKLQEYLREPWRIEFNNVAVVATTLADAIRHIAFSRKTRRSHGKVRGRSPKFFLVHKNYHGVAVRFRISANNINNRVNIKVECYHRDHPDMISFAIQNEAEDLAAFKINLI